MLIPKNIRKVDMIQAVWCFGIWRNPLTFPIWSQM